MKEFLVGLLFLVAVLVLSVIGLLLWPLLFVLTFFLRMAVILFLLLFSIWLLGKFIVLVWESLNKKV